jgi:hypothetical protein
MNTPPPARPLSLVNLLIWVYRDQLAHLNSHLALAMPIHRDDDEAPAQATTALWHRMARHGALGAHIPSTHHRHRTRLHGDAEAIHAAVAKLSQTDAYGAHLLARQAFLAQIPEYSDDIPIPEPVMRLNSFGRDEVVADAAIPGNGSTERIIAADPDTGAQTVRWVEAPYLFCPIRYWPSHADIARSQLDYRIWHRALGRLMEILPPLALWTVNGIGAQAMPWESKETGTATGKQSKRA